MDDFVDNEIYDPMSEELVVTKEMLDKKITDVTFRELIRVMVLIKKGKNMKVVQYDNPRDKILEVIQETPGINGNEIAKKLKMIYNTVKYHLTNLESKNSVRVEQDQTTKIKRYFPNDY